MHLPLPAMSFMPAHLAVADYVNKEQLALQQQRLVHLRHAMRCRHQHTAASPCPVSKHCLRLKTLWLHAGRCRDAQCSVRLCVSTRMALQHFGACKDALCAACLPVRASNKRTASAEDERDLLEAVDEYAEAKRPRSRQSSDEGRTVTISPEFSKIMQSLSLCTPCTSSSAHVVRCE